MKKMWYQTVGRPVSHAALFLGSALFSLNALATAVDALVVQPSAVSAPALMLAKYWQAGHDPVGFLVSEKLDGVRAFWNGRDLRFRSGRLIAAPAWFTAALPAIALDGELWLGRRSFDRLSGIVRRNTPVDAEWREVRYMIFDLPGEPGSFSERAARVAALVAVTNVPWLQAVEHWRVTDGKTLQGQLLRKVEEGAEGLVLHRADALWIAGRSDALRKLKLVPDEDARVISHLPGKGRHLGRMGALLLELPNGQRFVLGTGFSDAQRDVPPPIGSYVSYRYRDRTPAGLPRFASFLRVRETE
ncbi:MAG: DNA ligase [Comamonadaceae bacterium]